MTPEQKLILKYAALALAAFAVGCATALVPQLMDASQPTLNWRIVLGTGITALVTAYGGALLPRAGSEHIAAEVDRWRDIGYHRADLTIVPKAESVPSSELVKLPNVRTYNVLHGTGGHVAFLSTAEPSPGAEMPADSALHVYNRRPYASDGQPFRCDSCAEELHHVEAIDGDWIAI